MSIVIKELFPSDALSEALEKINFNFDQLILAGGGPPGPQGAQGAQGIAGPKGDRGDHWQVGSTGPTADHGPDFGQLLENDLWLGTGGTVYSYNPNTSTWVDTGTNLKGPKGDQGNTGSSVEFSLYAGITGISQQADSYGIDYNTVLTSDTSDVNFLVPLNTGKNAVFIGELDDSFINFSAWNNISDFLTAGRQKAVPKLTTMQSWIDRTGLNGIQFGAKGSTSAEIVTLSSPWEVDDLNGNNSSNIDPKTFFNAAFYLKQPRSVISPIVPKTSTWTHGFRLGTFKMDLDIQAGLPTSNPNNSALMGTFVPSINISAYKLFIEDFDKTRTIHSYYKSTHGATSTYIDITARPQTSNAITGPNTKGWVGLQTEQSTIPAGKEHGLGSVIIGTTANASFSIANEVSGLHIVRPITNHYDPNSASNGTDSHITLWSGSETSSTSFIAKFVGTRVAGFDSGLGYLQLQARRFAITPKISTTPTGNNQYNPLFPFTVIQDYNSLPPLIDNIGGVMSEVHGVISGFQNSSIYTSPSFGISIVNYVGGAIGIQAYSPNVSIVGSGVTQVTPDMYMQTGLESTYDPDGIPMDRKGNLGIGFNGESGTSAVSKLSVNGSVAIGSTFAGYHNLARITVPNGLLVQGTIVRGATNNAQAYSTDMLGVNQFLVALRSGNIGNISGNIDAGGNSFLTDNIQNHIGLSINKKAMAESYIARSRQTIPTQGLVGNSGNLYNAVPAFSLMDLRTGMDSRGATAEGWLVVAPLKNQIQPNPSVGYQNLTNNSLRSVPTARFSNRTEYTGLTGAGFQVTSRFATSVTYLNTQDLENLISLSTGYFDKSYGAFFQSGYDSVAFYEQMHCSLPTNRSCLFLDLSTTTSNYKVLSSNTRTYDYLTAPNFDNFWGTWTGAGGNWGSITPRVLQLANTPSNGGLLRDRKFSCFNNSYLVNNGGFQAQQNNLIYAYDLFNNLLITLDPGLYDGQEFTLIIGPNCLNSNKVVLSPYPILKNAGVESIFESASGNLSNVTTNFLYPNRLIMAREANPTYSNGLPYPWPINYVSAGQDTPNGANNPSADYWNWKWNNTSQNLSYTTETPVDNDFGVPIGYYVNHIGNGRAQGISASNGSFKFDSNRVIRFKWTRVSTTPLTLTYGGANYDVQLPNQSDPVLKYMQTGDGSSIDSVSTNHWAWVEIGREYLAQDYFTNINFYTPSGDFGEDGGEFQPGDGGGFPDPEGGPGGGFGGFGF